MDCLNKMCKDLYKHLPLYRAVGSDGAWAIINSSQEVYNSYLPAN